MTSRRNPPGGDPHHSDFPKSYAPLPEVLSLPTTGWRAGMEAVTLALLGDRRNDLPGPLLEVGCGDGGLLATLAIGRCGQPGIGLDLTPSAFLHVQSNRSTLTFMQADAQKIPCDDGAFGALLALDVFDQQGINLTDVLVESQRVLMPNGLLMIRVSAHDWLYGPHDIAFNTGRRYGCAETLGAVAATGFRIDRWTYANSLLSPLLIPQRLLQRWRIIPWQPSIYRARWSNRLVAAALKMDARWLKQHDFAFGLSLIVVARKKME